MDPKRLHELASRPGTFPEMVQATYHAGVDEGQEERQEEGKKVLTALRRYQRQIVWIASLLFFMGLVCVVNCTV
jgi:hypothetical protein